MGAPRGRVVWAVSRGAVMWIGAGLILGAFSATMVSGFVATNVGLSAGTGTGLSIAIAVLGIGVGTFVLLTGPIWRITRREPAPILKEL